MPFLPRKSFGDAEERIGVLEQQVVILDDYLKRTEVGDNLPISHQAPLSIAVEGGENSGVGGAATGGAKISGIAHDSHLHGYAFVDGVPIAITGDASVGTTGYPAREDHTHELGQTEDFDFGSVKITAEQLESDAEIGTPPLIVVSTDVVPNLNVDMVDGFHLDQNVLIASSPTFVDVHLTGASIKTTTNIPINFMPNDGLAFRISSSDIHNLKRTHMYGDNLFLYFGNNDDARMFYNGANFVINPKLVGSGYVDIQGNLAAVGGAFTGAVTVNTSTKSSHDDISITPQDTLSPLADYKGISINGAALDPNGGGVEIDGLFVDFSGVSLSNDPTLHGVHIKLPATYTGVVDKGGVHIEGFGQEFHAVQNAHIIKMAGDGNVLYNLDSTGVVVDKIQTGYAVIANITGSGAGEVHALEVQQIGSGSAEVQALATFGDVVVIHQHTGDPVALGKAWSVDSAVWTDRTDIFNSALGPDTILFEADNDVVYFGSLSVFDTIQIILGTVSSKDIIATIEYSKVGPAWQTFTPSDRTEGFQQSGNIAFDSDLTDWAAVQVNSEGDGPWYYIRITRTRAGTFTYPEVESVQVTVSTEHWWNADGQLRIHDIKLPNAAFVTADVTVDTYLEMTDFSGTVYRFPCENMGVP